MPDKTKVRRPTGMGAKGRRLWDGLTAEFEFGPHELAVLEAACREADLIERLDKELVGAELVVLGSMKQDVANPLLAEVRQHRATMAQLLNRLSLPADGDAAASRSASARNLANARWRMSG